MLHRLQRALSQNIEYNYVKYDPTENCETYSVVGTRGDDYTVSINRESTLSCTCPDHMIRNKLCKHLLKILIKEYSLNIHQLSNLDRNIHGGINETFAEASFEHDECDCPICLSKIERPEYFCHFCRNSFHTSCISEWWQVLQRQNLRPTCPLCRR